MRIPAGSPLLDTSHHLFAKFCVLERPRRLRRKAEDGLPVRGSLFQPYALRYNRLEHLRPENITYLLEHLPRERSALVEECHDDAEDTQVRVRTGFDFLNGFKKIV